MAARDSGKVGATHTTLFFRPRLEIYTFREWLLKAAFRQYLTAYIVHDSPL
jgi:hypothetical protein